MPALRAALSKPSKFKIVNMIIGTVGFEADIQVATSIPLMSGIAKSSKTRSGINSLNFLTPVHPFSASPQTIQSRERTIVARMRRVVSESSTIRIRKSVRDNISAPPMSRTQRGRLEPAVAVYLVLSHHIGTVRDYRDHLVSHELSSDTSLTPFVKPLYACTRSSGVRLRLNIRRKKRLPIKKSGQCLLQHPYNFVFQYEAVSHQLRLF